MSDFQKMDPASLAPKKAAINEKRRVKGKQMKPANRKILDAFKTLTQDGEWFHVPVPEELKADPDLYAKRISGFLTNQNQRNKAVYVDPDDSTKLIVERTPTLSAV